MRAVVCAVALGLGLLWACGEENSGGSAGAGTNTNANTNTSSSGGAATSVVVSNISATTVSSTGFVSTGGGAAGAPASGTTGYIDDCQPHVTPREDGCYLNHLCQDDLTLGGCDAWDDNVWRCGCNQPDEYFNFEVDSSDAEAACSSMIDWCLEGDGQIETEGDRFCGLEEDELYTNGDECYAVVACLQDGELDGMDVRALEYANLSCFYSFEQQQWECDCYWQGSGEEFIIASPPDREVDDELAEEICIQAAPLCPG